MSRQRLSGPADRPKALESRFFPLARTVAVCSIALAGVRFGAAAAEVDYTRDIKPLFSRHCQSCHGALKQKGGLRLDFGASIQHGGDNGAIFIPGRAGESRLMERVQSSDDSRRMPLGESPLSAAQVDLLREWIAQGARYPDDEPTPVSPGEHWSFQPVVRPAVPVVEDAGWVRNPIDQFVLSKLEKRGWRPSSPASPQALLRRVFLGLLGMPPTLEEQRAFLASSTQERLDGVVDDLLSRPEYGERWARHWLDLVRYAESNGYERDAIKPYVWRYRDYVIKALNADMPYRRFLVEQLAGDELDDATAETMIATGYYRLGHWDDEPADPLTDRFDQLDDIVNTTSQALLGLTLACARCHDHKFEPLTAEDYYSLLAVFDPLQRPRAGRTELSLPAGSRAELTALAERDRKVGELRRTDAALRAASLKRFLESGKSGLSAEAEAAFNADPGRRSAAQIKLVSANQMTLDKAHDGWMSPELHRRISEIANQIARLRRSTPDLPQAYFMRETSPKPPITHLLIRGQATRPGKRVEPAAPSIIAPRQPRFPAPGERTTRRRLGLAHWITNEENPLTARVMVNHVWRLHFGEGLVRTAGDFGFMGERPSHPELLDWLAHWFMHDADWSLKKLHRLILTSATWRMSRASNEAYATADPRNRLLWRASYRRLEVEAIRDSMLAVSGRLNVRMFGPSMYPSVPAQALEGHSDPGQIWKPFNEEDASRRTIYAFIKRTMVVPMLETLDLCDTTAPSAGRAVTTVAPQALTLYNGDFVNRQARHFAARLRSEVGPNTAALIDRAYELALCRPPTSGETAVMREFLQSEAEELRSEAGGLSDAEISVQSLKQLCRVIFNLNEFVYPE